MSRAETQEEKQGEATFMKVDERLPAAGADPTADGYRPPHPLVQLVNVRVREFFREPEAIFWVYGFPLLMALALGIAFRNQPVETYAVDIVEGGSAEAIAAALTSAEAEETTTDGGEAEQQTAIIEAEIHRLDAAKERLRTGRSALVVIPPEEGGSDAWRTEGVRYRFDPTRPESVSAREKIDDRLQRAAGRADAFEPNEQFVTEPGARYIDFLIPGLLGASLMGGGLFGLGFVTVDMRVKNLLKRFVTTPMKKTHFLASLMVSRFFFMVTEVLVLLLFARWVFGVSVQGSYLLVVLLVVLGAWTFSGIGLLVACRAKTLETASGLMNLVLIPMWIFSGIFFSSDRFPEAAQPVIKALPLTPLIDALRAVMLEGAGLGAILFPSLCLVVWGLVSFATALRFFRWY